MLHYATLFELEMRCITSMTRPQLIEAVWDRSDCLPADMREGTENETLDHIQFVAVCRAFCSRPATNAANAQGARGSQA